MDNPNNADVLGDGERELSIQSPQRLFNGWHTSLKIDGPNRLCTWPSTRGRLQGLAEAALCGAEWDGIPAHFAVFGFLGHKGLLQIDPPSCKLIIWLMTHKVMGDFGLPCQAN